MNAAESPRTSLSVGIVQLRRFREDPLVRNALIPGQHSKMSQKVRSREPTPDHNGARPLDQEWIVPLPRGRLGVNDDGFAGL
jgi:hypothetical protein